MIEIGYLITLVSIATGAFIIIKGKEIAKRKQIAEETWGKMKIFKEDTLNWNKEHQNFITYKVHGEERFTMHQRKRNEFRITFHTENGIQWSICLKESEFFRKSQIEIVNDYCDFLFYLKKDKVKWLQFQSWVQDIKKSYQSKIKDTGNANNWYEETVQKAKKLIKETREIDEETKKLIKKAKTRVKRVVTPSSTPVDSSDVKGLVIRYERLLAEREQKEKNEKKNTPVFQDMFEKMKVLEREGVYLSEEEHHILTRTFPNDLKELQMMYNGLDEKGKENMKEQIVQTKLYMEKVLHEIENQVRERKTKEMKIKMNVIQQRVTLDD